jgi:hypothetical protein
LTVIFLIYGNDVEIRTGVKLDLDGGYIQPSLLDGRRETCPTATLHHFGLESPDPQPLPAFIVAPSVMAPRTALAPGSATVPMLGLLPAVRDYFAQLKYKRKPRLVERLVVPDDRPGRNTMMPPSDRKSPMDDHQAGMWFRAPEPDDRSDMD